MLKVDDSVAAVLDQISNTRLGSNSDEGRQHSTLVAGTIGMHPMLLCDHVCYMMVSDNVCCM